MHFEPFLTLKIENSLKYSKFPDKVPKIFDVFDKVEVSKKYSKVPHKVPKLFKVPEKFESFQKYLEVPENDQKFPRISKPQKSIVRERDPTQVSG